MRRGKIIKRIIFVLFLLQKIKFGEMENNYPCVIIYIYLRLKVYIYDFIWAIFLSFFSSNLTLCKRNNAKIIRLIIF